MATSDLSGALHRLGIAPTVAVADPAVRTNSRRVDGRLLTFVANASPTPITTTVSMDGAERIARWDAVTTADTALERAPGEDPTVFVLELAPFGSAFLVEGADAPAGASAGEGEGVGARSVRLDGRWRLTLPGLTPRQFDAGPRLWTEDPGCVGFSGVGSYETRFTLSAADVEGRVDLQLGAVHDIAEIVVGGRSAGVVWTAPWRLDITDLVGEGENLLEVRVATGWRNRLVAEAKAATGEIYVPMTRVFTAEATPRPAGLTGPVSLLLGPDRQITRTMATHKH